jgi:hypothetical protein
MSRPEGSEKKGLLPSDAPDEVRSDDVTALDMSDCDPPPLTSKRWLQPTCIASRSARQKARILKRRRRPLTGLVSDRRNRVRGWGVVFQKPNIDFCNGLGEVLQKRWGLLPKSKSIRTMRLAQLQHQ